MHGLVFETSICYWQDQPDNRDLNRRHAGRDFTGGNQTGVERATFKRIRFCQAFEPSARRALPVRATNASLRIGREAIKISLASVSLLLTFPVIGFNRQKFHRLSECPSPFLTLNGSTDLTFTACTYLHKRAHAPGQPRFSVWLYAGFTLGRTVVVSYGRISRKSRFVREFRFQRTSRGNQTDVRANLVQTYPFLPSVRSIGSASASRMGNERFTSDRSRGFSKFYARRTEGGVTGKATFRVIF